MFCCLSHYPDKRLERRTGAPLRTPEGAICSKLKLPCDDAQLSGDERNCFLLRKRDCKRGMYVDGHSPRLKRGRSCEGGSAAQLHKGQRSFQLNETSKHRG